MRAGRGGQRNRGSSKPHRILGEPGIDLGRKENKTDLNWPLSSGWPDGNFPLPDSLWFWKREQKINWRWLCDLQLCLLYLACKLSPSTGLYTRRATGTVPRLPSRSRARRGLRQMPVSIKWCGDPHLGCSFPNINGDVGFLRLKWWEEIEVEEWNTPAGPCLYQAV